MLSNYFEMVNDFTNPNNAWLIEYPKGGKEKINTIYGWDLGTGNKYHWAPDKATALKMAKEWNEMNNANHRAKIWENMRITRTNDFGLLYVNY